MGYRSVFRPDLFAGQPVVVTGGGSGIGRCTAHELASLGAHVVLVGRKRDKLDRVQGELRQDGFESSALACDIRDEEAVRAAVAEVVASRGRIHGLVNNAGGQFPAPLAAISQKGFETVVRTNLTGGFLVAREVVTRSMADHGGAVVNIVADMWRGMPGMGHSGAARAGMVNLTQTMAVEWAPMGIRVNAVAPGWVASSGLDHYDEETRRSIIPRLAEAVQIQLRHRTRHRRTHHRPLALLNRPGDEPPWPNRIQGFSFSPMREHHDPATDRLPSVNEIDADLALLQGETYAVRTYTVKKAQAEIPRLAQAHGLNVALGAWLDANKEANEKELERFIQVAKNNPGNVIRLVVGNEAVLRKDLTVPEIIEYLDRVRAEVKIPTSTAEPWHVWIAHPELADHVDFIAAHLLPYWEGIPLDATVDYVAERYVELKKAFPNKPIVIGEVGWPSNGRTRKAAEASPANQAKFLRRFLAHAEKEKYTYYVMEAFDPAIRRQRST